MASQDFQKTFANRVSYIAPSGDEDEDGRHDNLKMTIGIGSDVNRSNSDEDEKLTMTLVPNRFKTGRLHLHNNNVNMPNSNEKTGR